MLKSNLHKRVYKWSTAVLFVVLAHGSVLAQSSGEPKSLDDLPDNKVEVQQILEQTSEEALTSAKYLGQGKHSNYADNNKLSQSAIDELTYMRKVSLPREINSAKAELMRLNTSLSKATADIGNLSKLDIVGSYNQDKLVELKMQEAALIKQKDLKAKELIVLENELNNNGE